MGITTAKLAEALSEVAAYGSKILYFKEDEQGRVIDVAAAKKGFFSNRKMVKDGYTRYKGFCRNNPHLVAEKILQLVVDNQGVLQDDKEKVNDAVRYLASFKLRLSKNLQPTDSTVTNRIDQASRLLNPHADRPSSGPFCVEDAFPQNPEQRARLKTMVQRNAEASRSLPSSPKTSFSPSSSDYSSSVRSSRTSSPSASPVPSSLASLDVPEATRIFPRKEVPAWKPEPDLILQAKILNRAELRKKIAPKLLYQDRLGTNAYALEDYFWAKYGERVCALGLESDPSIQKFMKDDLIGVFAKECVDAFANDLLNRKAWQAYRREILHQYPALGLIGWDIPLNSQEPIFKVEAAGFEQQIEALVCQANEEASNLVHEKGAALTTLEQGQIDRLRVNRKQWAKLIDFAEDLGIDTKDFYFDLNAAAPGTREFFSSKLFGIIKNRCAPVLQHKREEDPAFTVDAIYPEGLNRGISGTVNQNIFAAIERSLRTKISLKITGHSDLERRAQRGSKKNEKPDETYLAKSKSMLERTFLALLNPGKTPLAMLRSGTVPFLPHAETVLERLAEIDYSKRGWWFS